MSRVVKVDVEGNEWPTYTLTRKLRADGCIKIRHVMWRPKRSESGILDHWKGHQLRVKVGIFGGLCEVFEPWYSSNRKICDMVRNEADE